MSTKERGRKRVIPRRLPSKVQLFGAGEVARFIVRRHARVDGSVVVHCYAARGMRDDREGRSGGKVVYDTETQARSAAEEFKQAGMEEHNAYPCHRKWDGGQHWHLTTMETGSDFVQQAS